MRRRRRLARIVVPALVIALAATRAHATPLALPPGTAAAVVDLYGVARPAVRLTAPGALHASLTGAAVAPRLVTAIAVPEGGTSAPVRFRIVLERAGERIELYARTVDPADPRDRRWIDVGRDLPPQPIDHGVLHFEVEPTRPGATPALLVAVPALVACEPAGRSLLLVTVAGLPATAPSMPRLDRFAPTATRFTRAFAGAPTTFPALPQVLTGSYFPESRTAPGLTGLLDGVAPEATRAIVGDAAAAAWIADEHPGFGTVVRTARGARDLTSDALRFLTAFGRCSTSLYVHYGRTDDTPRRSVMRRTGTDEARIAAIDRAVARLLRGVTRRGRLEDTVVMVVGMPGTAPGDADAASLRDAALHVPFLARFPGIPPGRTVDTPVGTIDVVATVRAATSRTPSEGDGESLLPLVRGAAAPADRILFARTEATAAGVPLQMVRSSTRKLVHDVADGARALYDLTTDPDEHRDLGTTAPEARTLGRALDGVRSRLAESGYQLRLQSHRGDPVTYVVTLTSADALPLVAVDRVNLEAGDTIAWDATRGTLTMRGTLEAQGEDRLRFDAPSATAGIAIAVVVHDAPLPTDALRLGAGAVPATGPILLADARLAGEPRHRTTAIPPDRRRHAEVEVALWRQVPPELDTDGLPLRRRRALGLHRLTRRSTEDACAAPRRAGWGRADVSGCYAEPKSHRPGGSTRRGPATRRRTHRGRRRGDRVVRSTGAEASEGRRRHTR